jgi:FK506-binding nuclear protein
VLFKVSGTHSVFLTGNYVEPAGQSAQDDYDSEDDEDEYDLEPDSDEELDIDEEDELDDIDDPRIMEIDDEEEAPVLVKADKKGKNKRAAEDDEALDALISKAKKDDVPADEVKLSKKQQKKQKKNDGSAVEVAAENGSAKSDKKVQFAKELEQGPTPTKDSKAKPAASLGVRKVQGVTVDDKKIGSGPAAKAGDRVGMRYIGKLEKNGQVFDSNKKGKPFTFKLGAGEVIKGWDIGIAGMSVGGERRITIPANLAYGSKGAPPDIPGNSTLVFDVKLLEIKGR